MKKIILLCIIAILCTSCVAYQRWQKRELVKQFVRCVEYVKDPRNKLCFAYNWCQGGIAIVERRHCQ